MTELCCDSEIDRRFKASLTNFPLIITATLAKFDVSEILIDSGNSCEIIYSELFEKMDLDKNSLWSYEVFDLWAFNEITTVLGDMWS